MFEARSDDDADVWLFLHQWTRLVWSKHDLVLNQPGFIGLFLFLKK